MAEGGEAAGKDTGGGSPGGRWGKHGGQGGRSRRTGPEDSEQVAAASRVRAESGSQHASERWVYGIGGDLSACDGGERVSASEAEAQGASGPVRGRAATGAVSSGFFHFHVHKQKQCVLFIEDDYSRFIAGWAMVPEEKADAVIECFESSVQRYGKPEGAMSDRGSAFHSWKGLSRFEAMLESYEINSEPRTEGKNFRDATSVQHRQFVAICPNSTRKGTAHRRR